MIRSALVAVSALIALELSAHAGADVVAKHIEGRIPDLTSCVDFSQATCSDQDGDGWWSVEIEMFSGSDPNDAESTPEHGLIDEQWGLNACHDGLDNDLDGKRDGGDFGCRVTCKDFASMQLCVDKDGDGWVGYVEEEFGSNPKDPLSTPEWYRAEGTCFDALDNDGDGFVDAADSGCEIPF